MNNRLGKGLEALIKTSDSNQDNYVDGFINIVKIKINPDQPRKYFNKKSLMELVSSIKEKGILQPITIKSLGNDTFELIAGERRLRASKILGLNTIPAYIIKVDSDSEKLELALIENIQRNDLSVIEEAEAYCILKKKYNLTHEEIAKRVGKGRVEITRTIELIRLPDNIKQALVKNLNDSKFSFSRGHARTILSLKDPIKIQTIFDRIIREKLSVRKTEQLVKKINNKGDIPKHLPKKSHFLGDESLLSSLLEAKVEVLSKRNNSGHIKIIFQSEEDKARIVDIIKSLKK